MLHSKVAMKGLAEEKNICNTLSLICSLALQLIYTEEAFTVDGRRHTRTQTHTHVSGKLVIAPLPRTLWPIFTLFLIFYRYFTSLKVRNIKATLSPVHLFAIRG